MSRLGIVVNPMSGRDVRRVAARASTQTHHDKQQTVTRLVLAALEQGVTDVYLANEPFRINSRAIENLPQREQAHLLDFRLTHTAQDTETMVNLMWEEGCRTFIVLGGDGTNRIVSRTRPDAAMLPLSTGTNNVFPYMIEASVAGAAAGLVASGRVPVAGNCPRAKRVHVTTETTSDFALVDAVLLRNDILGNFLPFEAEKIAALILAIAEPASIGMSPIGGYLMPCSQDDDAAVSIVTGKPAVAQIRAPISAGLYGDIPVSRIERIPLDQSVTLEGPGILAFDGDREIKVADKEKVTVTVRRDGPYLIEPRRVMAAAVKTGALAGTSNTPG
ncbi:MAG: NAD(+)/NADH kinase [Pseudomonadales bacterium]|nr:NAD(+)/NADH kinase [Pseudomonadales bacterium]